MQKVHFIGIGGIGISAIARFLKEKNFIISGSDIKETQTIIDLRNEGIRVITPHSADIIQDQDMVVYSAAIKPENTELIAAKEKGIKCLSRKEILPFILNDKRVFSVAGAHGKSTTSSMLASLVDGSVIIGAISKQFGSNMKYFESENVIFEADESDSSFLNSNPYLAVVTNAEPEHMEHYDYDLDKFYAAYTGFLQRAKVRVINAEDEFLSTLKMDCIKLYPSKDITDSKMVLRNYEPYMSFNLKNLGTFEVFGIGEHIAIDASLAILAANCEVGLESIRENLAKYKGIKKRFDILKASKDFILIDDYGHHPTEIKATLKSAKEYANMLGISQITVIWQPHRFTRLKANLQSFKTCFEGVDDIVILPVYSGGEADNGINLKKEFKELRPNFAKRVFNEDGAITFNDEFDVKHRMDEGLVIGFGAGDITYQLRGEI
ncbi:UDP-N-acetylmuramate--L-alanine ligase [Campylobacter sputorum subsp. bubulus]|uniref:UDP-N-acetylmuramate--L-alanine ligase n=1 Tax=Campylobacter sputorum subsp. sputorum TaxID=32024 RepID=A0A381DHI7_9BACT|nr:UDP-N-acetylmuramate--L-alanine ligase [Campylobacter sputorum]ASM35205.1 UDP-N-acetylmuramate-alanine ligase [Campylobacter sputorum aubsp. sputorum RM3237]KAB0580987.1 UDP-N-acetylmuramate--L-alanine ligase [Campylobacter sputorum subsp. sputorum]QEL05394.1 UDP-N-acetylmuramate-alanine ligase [Campylobacter sputorum subsp. sputorum]SUX08795.1 UDP-N-acetylmuramate--L-alanine ligase [Campylobacter sputorum subsp. bubulus]SUX10070.1 UDP-N-acetylmuramate--L-alanine ligase [Campylobacter sputo